MLFVLDIMQAHQKEKGVTCTSKKKRKKKNYVGGETPPTPIKEKETLWSAHLFQEKQFHILTTDIVKVKSACHSVSPI